MSSPSRASSAGLGGGGFGGVDKLHGAAHDARKQRLQQWVMRATEHQGIDALREFGTDRPLSPMSARLAL